MKSRSLAHWLTVLAVTLICFCGSLASSFAEEVDVSDKVQLTKGRLMYDRVAKVSYLDVSLKNISEKALLAPVVVVIESISPATVTVANADGYTPDGKPYFQYTLADGLLSPSEATGNKTWRFSNLAAAKYTYTTSVGAGLPDVAAMIGPEGGVVEVTDSGSPLFGVIIEVPKGTFLNQGYVSLQKVDYNGITLNFGKSVTDAFRIKSNELLKKYVKVTLPLKNDIINKNNIIVAHKDTEDKSIEYLFSIQSNLDKSISFLTRSFSEFEGVEYANEQSERELDLLIYQKLVYPSIMRLVKNSEFMIDAQDDWEKEQVEYAENVALYFDTAKMMLEASKKSLTAEEAKMILTDFFVGSLIDLYPNDVLQPGRELYACVISGFIDAFYTSSPTLIWPILSSCGTDLLKNIYLAEVRAFSSWFINNDTKRINEAWIAADYLKMYYSLNKDISDISASLSMPIGSTESEIIKEIAKRGYKNSWFSFDDYNLDRVSELVNQYKNNVASQRANIDGDSDFIGAAPFGSDNCPTISNPNQADSDNDGIGDACEAPSTPPAPPTLNSPGSGETVVSTNTIPFTWTSDPSNPATTRWCLTINNRGTDLSSASDDTTAYNTCDPARGEYELLSANQYTLPAYTLDPEVNYTWAVHAIDTATNLSSASGWINFRTAAPVPVCTDSDSDGFYLEAGCGTEQDCDDADATRNPGLSELCRDGKDNNCDGQVDEGCGNAGNYETLLYESFENLSIGPVEGQGQWISDLENHSSPLISSLNYHAGSQSLTGDGAASSYNDCKLHKATNFENNGGFSFWFYCKDGLTSWASVEISDNKIPRSTVDDLSILCSTDTSNIKVMSTTNDGFSTGHRRDFNLGNEFNKWHKVEFSWAIANEGYRVKIDNGEWSSWYPKKTWYHNLITTMKLKISNNSNIFIDDILFYNDSRDTDNDGIFDRFDNCPYIYNQDQEAVCNPINDTGITWGGNYPSGNNTDCTSNIDAPQDCHQGRDATHNDDSDGHAGFSYTKLDANGNDLPASATQWSCVRDNVTGLVWEVKTDDGGIHDKDNAYRWGGKTALGSGFGTYYSDWDSLVDGSNNEQLCGFTGWRVPTLQELLGLVDYGQSNPSIDTAYFVNTRASYFWSASPYGPSTTYSWRISFSNGANSVGSRVYYLDYHSVRLVHGKQ